MEMDHWSFRSTDADFDGERIARDAMDAGLQVFEVCRGGESRVFATVRFCERLHKSGVWMDTCTLEASPNVVPGLSGRAVEHVLAERQGYCIVRLNKGVALREMVARLEEVEARQLRTTVCGWRDV